MRNPSPKVLWKQQALPFVGGGGGGATNKPPEGKDAPPEKPEPPKVRKARLKKDLERITAEVERAQQDMSNLAEDHPMDGFKTWEDRYAHYKGKDSLERYQNNKKQIPEIKKDIQVQEKRELAMAALREEKKQKLAKVRLKTRDIDEKMRNQMDHVTGVDPVLRTKDWLREKAFYSEQQIDDYLIDKALQSKYEKELDGPDEEPTPPTKRAMPMTEDEKKRILWRKALAAFHPHKAFAERARAGAGKEIEKIYSEAMQQAKEKAYDEAIKLLNNATTLAKRAELALQSECEKLKLETMKAEDEQAEAFAFTTKVKDKEWGFDPDTDAPNFYLANSINELGGLETSPQLKKMQKVYTDCLKRRDQLKKQGASIGQIVDAVYKNIPKNFWPDDVVKEVMLYKAAKKEIEAEEGLAQSELDLEGAMEKVEDGPGFLGEQTDQSYECSLWVDTIKQKIDTGTWAGTKNSEGEKIEVDTSKLTDTLSTYSTIFSALADTSMGFLNMASALDSQSELDEEDKKENPVKAKILEFQRNKALIQCVESLLSAGGDIAGAALVADALPVLGIITKSKDVLVDLAGAVSYFQNLAQIEKIKKGAQIDPRSAALLPLARQAREQKIAASDKLVSAVANMLKLAGKATEVGGVTVAVSMGLAIAGSAVSYGGKIVIASINWSDASKAVQSIKLAAGPPPNRKAQFDVLKNSAKYARVALAHLALKDRDPWAIGHLENLGLKREEIIIPPATSTKLLREYMTLKSGGIGEEQETFGESKVARAGKFLARGVVKGAKMVRDLIVGRDTGIPYDSDWRKDANTVAFAAEDWQKVRQEAIAAGWYDSRPEIGADLTAYQQAHEKFVADLKNDPKANDTKALNQAIGAASALIEAVVAIRNHMRSIKALANDEVTPHAGMAAFLDVWGKKADDEATAATKKRSEWIDRMAFGGKTGTQLEQAKEEILTNAVKLAQENQAKKATEVRNKVEALWNSRSIPSPYGSTTMEKFTALAAKRLNLNGSETEALKSEVEILQLMVLEQLSQEVMAAPNEKELKERFEQSAKNYESLVVEGLRAACAEQYQIMVERTGATDGADGWKPGSGDVVLTVSAWEGVKKIAEKGWTGKSVDLNAPLKQYENALLTFTQSDRSEENRTQLEQTQGVLLGQIDALVEALEKFQPLTNNQFNHPGLSAWRDEMIDLCASRRVEYAGALLDLK